MGAKMRLFDDFDRYELRPSWQRESYYSYLNNSARPDIARIRLTLEHWFRLYPEPCRAQLKQQFADASDNSQFFNLLAHKLIMQLADQDSEIRHQIKANDPVPVTQAKLAGVSTDIRINSISISQGGVSEPVLQNPHIIRFIDGVDQKLWLQGIFLDLDFEGRFREPIPLRRFEAFINRHARGLKHDQLRRTGALGKRPQWKFEVGEACIRVTPWPCPSPQQIPARTVGSFGTYDRKASGSGPGGLDANFGIRPKQRSVEIIRPNIEIANLVSGLAGTPNLERELFACKKRLWSLKNDHLRARCKDHGLWNPSQNTRVSAVIALIGCTPLSFWDRKPSLWLNPWAAKKWCPEPFRGLIAIFRMGKNGVQMESDGLSLGELLELGSAFPAADVINTDLRAG